MLLIEDSKKKTLIIQCYITLDPRLPFTDSIAGFFPGPASLPGYWMFVFLQLAATMNDSFGHDD